MKRLLLTRSRHDGGNNYLYAYSEPLVKHAESKAWNIVKVEDEKNNPVEVQSRLSKVKPQLVVFNGHGNDSEICGYKDETIISLDSAGLLSETITFARSCSAVNELGKEAVGQGCLAFVGYSGLFLVPHTYEYEATPLKDPSAKPVLEVSNTVAASLLNGSTVETAVKAGKRKAAELMLKMLTTEEPYDKPALKALFENDLNLTFTGNAQASCRTNG